MPELLTVAGENVINLSNRESFLRNAGAVYAPSEEIAAFYDVLASAGETDELDFNSFPI